MSNSGGYASILEIQEDANSILVVPAASVTSSSISRTSLNKFERLD